MNQAAYLGFLNTPALWQNRQFGIQQFEFPRLEMAHFKPQPIPGNIRLGHRMEYVFQQLLAHSDTYIVNLHNLPIREAGKTLGEIDFLLSRNNQEEFIHVELTYKFYILDPAIPEPIHQLIGPNRRDSFFDKLQKIRQRQFPLLHTSAGVQALAKHRIDHTQVLHQCCFKAQLFVPFGGKMDLLDTLNQDCIVGFWLRLEAFKTEAFTKGQYYIPDKSEWGVEANEQVTWLPHSAAIAVIQEQLAQARAPLIWCRRSPHQYEKLFVVWW